MPDFDRGVNLTSVSRRKLLTGAAAAPMFPAASPGHAESDPIWPLWQEWQRQRARAADLCRRWQNIESHLLRKIGVPHVLVTSPDKPDGIRANSHAEIDRAVGRASGVLEAQSSLHADLQSQQSSWNAEAEALGFDDIERQEAEAWYDETQLSDAIFETRATSLAGVEIKIALIIELCSTGADDQEFPWPQLRSTLADMKHIPRSS